MIGEDGERCAPFVPIQSCCTLCLNVNRVFMPPLLTVPRSANPSGIASCERRATPSRQDKQGEEAGGWGEYQATAVAWLHVCGLASRDDLLVLLEITGHTEGFGTR